MAQAREKNGKTVPVTVERNLLFLALDLTTRPEPTAKALTQITRQLRRLADRLDVYREEKFPQ